MEFLVEMGRGEGRERERVKGELEEQDEEKETLEKCRIITIFLQFSLPNMLWLQFGDLVMLRL